MNRSDPFHTQIDQVQQHLAQHTRHLARLENLVGGLQERQEQQKFFLDTVFNQERYRPKLKQPTQPLHCRGRQNLQPPAYLGPDLGAAEDQQLSQRVGRAFQQIHGLLQRQEGMQRRLERAQMAQGEIVEQMQYHCRQLFFQQQQLLDLLRAFPIDQGLLLKQIDHKVTRVAKTPA
jgi:hypothetical protein